MDAAQERARLRLAAAAGHLRGLRAAFEVCAARVRGLALDAEARLLQLGVPMNAGARHGMLPLPPDVLGRGGRAMARRRSCRRPGIWAHGGVAGRPLLLNF